MAQNKTLELSIKIAGKVDKSLTTAINQTNTLMGSLTTTMSKVGTAGLAAMGALATATAAGLAKCTSEAAKLENNMSAMVRYVDGLTESATTSTEQAQSNLKAMRTYIQDLSTQIPRTTEQISKMSAALGQSGIGADRQMSTGILRDTAVAATAMDLEDDTAGNYMAKWEAAFNFNHDQVMTLMDQINYLGANNATTAAEIAQSVNQAASMGQIAGVDPSATAAIATAMQATGVATDRVGTSISRIYTNISKGSNATKAQKAMWEELGFTAEGIARSMQSDGIGTLKSVFQAINNMPDERKVAALNTLFGQWAIEGGAKITQNLALLEKTLGEVNDPGLYTGSMEREFLIEASTPEAVDLMLSNAKAALMQDIGQAFLPAKKEFSLSMIDFLNQIRKNMPELTTLANSLGKIASDGVERLGDAMERALPYIQKGLDYLANNGPQVASTLGKLAAVFVLFKVLLQLAYVPSGSMETTIPTKCLLVGWRLPYVVSDPVPERGDIVTFWDEELNKVLVKRVVGLPGETLSFKNGYTYVNGEKLDESYLPTQGITTLPDSMADKTFTVPEGCMFVMGDNRTGSNDSRLLGEPYIPVEAAQARMLVAISVGSDQSWQGVRWIG